MLTKEKLISKIDNRFHQNLSDRNYKVISVKAKELLTSNRADICLKYFFIKAIANDDAEIIQELKKAYLDTISAFTNGLFQEPGDTNTKCEYDYIYKFNELFLSIKKNGFNNNQLIPLSRDMTPLDGAHRIAIAALFDLSIDCVVLDIATCKYDISYFESKFVNDSTVDRLLESILKLDHDLRLAIIWPYCTLEISKLLVAFGDDFVFSKEMILNKNGVNNLCVLSYSNESWIGNSKNSWSGSYNKSNKCYRSDKPTYSILYKTRGRSKDVELKESIRGMLDGEKHNLHSTDSYEEAVQLSLTCFSREAVTFLNNINLNKMHKYLDFQSDLSESKLDFVFVGSGLLELLGGRSANDIDIIVKPEQLSIIESHNKYYQLYPKPLNYYFNFDLFVFDFMGLKFINIDDLIKFKKNRGENKDKVDVIDLKNILHDNKLSVRIFIKRLSFVIKRNKVVLKSKLAYYLSVILKRIGLFQFFRKIIRPLRK